MKVLVLAALLIAGVMSAPLTRPPCLMICQMIYLPVCGSDGHTYGNQCELESITCMKNEKVVKAHDGPCDRVTPNIMIQQE